MLKNRRHIIASAREKVLITEPEREVSKSSTIKAVEISKRSGSSLETVSFLTLIGRTTAAMPINKSTLTILLPMTLPTRISVLPLISDEKETASSGAPVPKATTVRPMRSLLTLKLDATEDAPSTSQSAPLIKSAKPITKRTTCKSISMVMVIISQVNNRFLLSIYIAYHKCDIML